ncbi:hypothetical protein Tco_0193542 [Tanacetum coccineum]
MLQLQGLTELGGNNTTGQAKNHEWEQMEFLTDNEDTVTIGQQSQEIPTPATFQTDDLDAFDSDYDEAPSMTNQVDKCNEVDKENKIDGQLRKVIINKNAKVADFEN